MQWMRFENQGSIGFGLAKSNLVRCDGGDMFGTPEAKQTLLAVADLKLLPPCQPGKIIGLWNNFRAAATT